MGDMLYDKIWYKTKKCEELITPEEKEKKVYEPINCELEMKQLTFDHIVLQLILLGIFMLIGTMVFLAEICFKKGKIGNNLIILPHLLFI